MTRVHADLHAERAVLGAAILDRDLAVEVCALLAAKDFHNDRHALVYEALRAQLEANQPADTLGVRGQLEAAGKLQRVGGDEYLLALTDTIPLLRDVVAHAERVRSLAALRGALDAMRRVLAEADEGVEDVSDFLARAEESISRATRERSLSSAPVPMSDVVDEVFAQVIERAEGKRLGHRTGFAKFDEYLGGMVPGELIALGGRPGMGKAQPLDEPVLTPTGWRAIGDLNVGDFVIGANGEPTRVTGVFDRGVLPVFRLKLTDGAWTRCCGEHLWKTRTRSDRRSGKSGAVRSTAEIAATISRCDGGKNHSIPYMAPARLDPVSEQPIDPWLLGLYLADGHYSRGSVHISNPEPDIIERIGALLPPGETIASSDGLNWRIRKRVRGPERTATGMALDRLGLRGVDSFGKFIPPECLRGSVRQRTLLLQGLLDGDGNVAMEGTKTLELSTASERLAAGITELVGSLGGRVTSVVRETAYRKDGERHPCAKAHRMHISFPRGDVVPVSSRKHLARYDQGKHRLNERFIESVTPDGMEPCRCIAVDAEDHLYVTRGYIVTHNTSLALQLASGVERYSAQPVLVQSIEMPRVQLAMRALSAESMVDGQKLRDGSKLSRGDMDELRDAGSRLSKQRIWIDDCGSVTVADIALKARRMQRQHGLAMLVVDYLQLIRSGARAESREEAVGEISRALKALAKDLRIPVLALVSLNRKCEDRGKDKRPQISDIRESGTIESDADTVLLLYRDEVYNAGTDDKNIAELIIGKQRNGPTGTIRLRFDASRTRFDNLEQYGREGYA